MGSGGTTSNPTIPDEFRPFVTGTMGQWMGQQAANPIGAYNGNNAMDVEGMTPWQQMAMGQAAGGMLASPTEGLAMQAAQRAAGMSGAGPTTGQYNPQGEMGLQDWMQLMNPYVGGGAELGGTEAPRNVLNDFQGANANPQGPAPPNFGGGPPSVGQGGTNLPINWDTLTGAPPSIMPGQGGGPGGGGPGGGGGSSPGAGGLGGDWAARMAAHSGGFGQASNAGLMPAGYQPRNTMSDEDFQSAVSKYGIDQNLMSQEHGAARSNMLDALGVPAAQIALINSHISRSHSDARRAAGPDQTAHGVVSGADSRSAFNDSQVDAAARAAQGPTGGGNVPIAHRTNPTQAPPRQSRPGTVTR